MTSEKEDIRSCRNEEEMIRCALDEAAAIHITYKRFREGDFNLRNKEMVSANLEKLKTRNHGVYWIETQGEEELGVKDEQNRFLSLKEAETL